MELESGGFDGINLWVWQSVGEDDGCGEVAGSDVAVFSFSFVFFWLWGHPLGHLFTGRERMVRAELRWWMGHGCVAAEESRCSRAWCGLALVHGSVLPAP